MTTTERNNRLLPLWEKAIELAGEIKLKASKYHDRGFAKRQIKVAGDIVESMLRALQHMVEPQKAYLAVADARGHCTELTLMIMRAEALNYFDRDTSRNFLSKIYQLNAGFEKLR